MWPGEKEQVATAAVLVPPRLAPPQRVGILHDLGRSLDEPLGALDRWADSSWRSIEDARLLWDRRSHKVRSDQSNSSHTAVRTGTPR